MIKINRRERRRQQREVAKEDKRIKKEINSIITNDLKMNNSNKYVNSLMSLESEQARYLSEIARKQADKIAEDRVEEMQSIIDRCITAFLIERFPEYEWQEIVKAEDALAKIMEEDIKKYVDITGGNEKMVKKKIKELEDRTEEKCKELIEQGFNQQRIIESLKDEFKELSTAMAAVAYKKVRTALDSTVKEIFEYLQQHEETIQSQNTEKNVNTIMKKFKVGEKIARQCYEKWKDDYCKSKLTEEDIQDLKKEIKAKNHEIYKSKQEKNKKETKKEIEKEVQEEIKEELKKEVKEDIKEEKKMSKLRVVKKVIEIEGEFGKYVIDGEVIKKGEEQFNGVADIDKYEKEEIKKLEQQIAELREVAKMA